MSVRFAGYAAVFDRIDRGGDVVRKGAFAGAAPVPLLWQHRGTPVGAIERLDEDANGLRVIGRIDDPQLAGLVKAGAVSGLSFGYRVTAMRGQGRTRELTGLDLVEVSLVATPMQPLARVCGVQDYDGTASPICLNQPNDTNFVDATERHRDSGG